VEVNKNGCRDYGLNLKNAEIIFIS
jgi:hypothetical protein